MYIIAFSHGDPNVKWELNCAVHLRVDTHFSLSYLQTHNMSATLRFDMSVENLRILSCLRNWNGLTNSLRNTSM